MLPVRHSIFATLLIALFAFAAPAAVAQEYTTPTTPDYTAPDDTAGEAPDDDAGAPDDDDEGAAPDTGAGAPGDQTRPLPSGALPATGFEEVVLLSVFGFVLLLGGVTMRRSLRST